jgi:hypothetical protein
MRKNSYSQAMAKKSDTALTLILEEKQKYNEEAIQAVVWELEERGIIEKDSIVLDFVPLEIENLAQPSKDADVEQGSANEQISRPLLYSKRAILGFTIFFSTLFGVLLLMRNLKKLEQSKARFEVLVFGILYTFLTMVLANYLPTTLFLTFLFNGIGYAVLVEYFWNKNIGKNLEYEKEEIKKPLIISLIIVGVIVLLQFLPGLLSA